MSESEKLKDRAEVATSQFFESCDEMRRAEERWDRDGINLGEWMRLNINLQQLSSAMDRAQAALRAHKRAVAAPACDEKV